MIPATSSGWAPTKTMGFLFVVCGIKVRRERTERRAHTLSTVRATVAMMIDFQLLTKLLTID